MENGDTEMLPQMRPNIKKQRRDKFARRPKFRPTVFFR